jgi:regulator of sigma E protease
MTLDGVLFWAVAIPVMLLVLGVLVMVHELGHFAAARLVGIKVLEFGIGFPPRAKVIGRDHETEYTLNYLPIGGFTRLEGEETNSDDPRSFVGASLPRQLFVLVAGVAMNIVTAFALFFLVALFFNPTISVKFDQVVPSSAAEINGLLPGETIESINGQKYGFVAGSDLLAEIRANAGETVTLGYIDLQGNHRTMVVTLGTDTSAGILGIGKMQQVVSYSGTDPLAAAGTAGNQTWTSLGLVLDGLGKLGSSILSNPTEAPDGVQGPAGITETVGRVTLDFGLPILILLAAILSANLALVNILPFPPLDGGKIVIMVVKRLFGQRGISAVEATTYLVGFVMLLAFIAWITFFDLLRMGSGGP